ncbi:3-oxoacyl-ACP synthase III [Tessaracoccus antarcticus]|uniref:3-oxoacyl-ACP synthase III n=1 Tax=Tessaracoccus antarcticus TaxID=2479848 RepID=A0A3M0GAM1_9ACTN|nr:3-oxoacyl-ACP synthase III [Tessaracoccus antarcticus]RMB62010.1 3-oxoacyl-ACP synthase III [Tessaracoccus antarcticus]
MSGNATFRLANTAILAVTRVEAPEVVTSDSLDDRLEGTYARIGMARGGLAGLAGVEERRWWPEGTSYITGGVEAGRMALEQAGVTPDQVGLLINASVSRPHLEPSVATQVHDELGMPTSCLNFDITNACLGFVNAMQVAGSMIDAGQADYALIVASEGTREPQERTLDRLVNGETTKDELKEAFATLTVGSGAAAMVLGRVDQHPEGHRIIGGLSRAGTSHHGLCIGTMEEMHTDSRALYVEGMALVTTAWEEAKSEFEWSDMDAYIPHQTSTSHLRGLSRALKLDNSKLAVSLVHHGNTAAASVPFTLAQEAPSLKSGDRVLLMGIGSGLNTSFTEVAW